MKFSSLFPFTLTFPSKLRAPSASPPSFTLTLTLAFASPGFLLAQNIKPDEPSAPVKLDSVAVTAHRPLPSTDDPLAFPGTTSIAAQKIAETVNLVDPEDAVKYLPSLFLRKRNSGDTQAVLATRTWGVSSSARSLIFADGVPLSALIANNNNIGGPRWGLVAPSEIERVDLMYGPFSAAYAGNSMGAVMEITTRLPKVAEGSLEQTVAWQTFSLYGTHSTYRTEQSAATVGGQRGRFSFWVSANSQDSFSQPLSFVTGTTFPAGTTGGYAATNKLGATADILGAGGLLHTEMANVKFKVAADLTPTLRAAYTFGFWQNEANSTTETYLRDSAGIPTFAGLAGFASGEYLLREQHSAHSLVVKTDSRGNWNFTGVASLYRMDQDDQRTPLLASATGTAFGSAGRVAVLGGTGWSNLDLKALWRAGGESGAHRLTFGLHDDRYKLYNPTFNTSDWQNRTPLSSVATEGDGKTRTQAFWIQDLWRINPALSLTIGGRDESWRAYDGFNVNGSIAIQQPNLEATKFSPKAVLAWTPAPPWTVTASFGQAYRFATASELYQLVSTGSTFTAPNPNLKPDDVLASELKIERAFQAGRVRLSLFEDDVHDAIISQFNPLVPGSTALFSYVSNVDHVRARGLEAVLERTDLFVPGLEFSGSLTYLDARTLATSGQASATAPLGSALGRRLPNIPEWRASFVLTYRPNEQWAVTLAGRYSGKLFTTLDDADVNSNTYQGFAAWFVADAHVHGRFSRHWSGSVGADNLLNRKYFLFHPFPQRTVLLDTTYTF